MVAASDGVARLGRSRGGQAPACGKNRPQGAAGINIIVQIIERGSSGGGVVKHIVRLAISVEIGGSPQLIAACNRRPKGAAHIHASTIQPLATRMGFRPNRVEFRVSE